MDPTVTELCIHINQALLLFLRLLSKQCLKLHRWSIFHQKVNILYIHVLATAESYFYTYDETVGKKGADDVVPILDNFINTYTLAETRNLAIFCDSCAGQNKNYTMFRYLHSLVATRERFDCVTITFPVRGHSYLECDTNMGLINQKSSMETPSGWRTVIAGARHNSSPFVVVNCQQSMFKQFTKYLKPGYKPVCPFQTRPIKEFRVEKGQPNLVYLRDNFIGAWTGEILEKTLLLRKGKSSTAYEASTE